MKTSGTQPANIAAKGAEKAGGTVAGVGGESALTERDRLWARGDHRMNTKLDIHIPPATNSS